MPHHLPLSWAQVPRFELNYGDPTAATILLCRTGWGLTISRFSVACPYFTLGYCFSICRRWGCRDGGKGVDEGVSQVALQFFAILFYLHYIHIYTNIQSSMTIQSTCASHSPSSSSRCLVPVSCHPFLGSLLTLSRPY
jgi:hypothetical protein